jgi:hypothetical protein
MNNCKDCERSEVQCDRCGEPVCDAHLDSEYPVCLYCVGTVIDLDHDETIHLSSTLPD